MVREHLVASLEALLLAPAKEEVDPSTIVLDRRLAQQSGDEVGVNGFNERCVGVARSARSQRSPACRERLRLLDRSSSTSLRRRQSELVQVLVDHSPRVGVGETCEVGRRVRALATPEHDSWMRRSGPTLALFLPAHADSPFESAPLGAPLKTAYPGNPRLRPSSLEGASRLPWRALAVHGTSWQVGTTGLKITESAVQVCLRPQGKPQSRKALGLSALVGDALQARPDLHALDRPRQATDPLSSRP